eukprot:scaffold33485_cov35-Tisochrysis_lutea.AAC.4
MKVAISYARALGSLDFQFSSASGPRSSSFLGRPISSLSFSFGARRARGSDRVRAGCGGEGGHVGARPWRARVALAWGRALRERREGRRRGGGRRAGPPARAREGGSAAEEGSLDSEKSLRV